MHCLLALLLALKSATVIDVQGNHEVTLALQVGDVIYSAEFFAARSEARQLH